MNIFRWIVLSLTVLFIVTNLGPAWLLFMSYPPHSVWIDE